MMAYVKRDPGLEIAAHDLYKAAAMIVASRPLSAAVVDAKPWRLLMDAAHRIRARLNALVPRHDVQSQLAETAVGRPGCSATEQPSAGARNLCGSGCDSNLAQ